MPLSDREYLEGKLSQLKGQLNKVGIEHKVEMAIYESKTAMIYELIDDIERQLETE